MKRLLAFLILGSSLGFGQGQNFPGGSSSTTAPNLTPFNALAYGAKFNSQVCTTAGIASGSTTIVCPTATFTGADVGKTEWVMDQNGNVLSVPQGTISSVTDTTHIVVSLAATRNLTVANSGLLIWGTNDDAALHTGWTAAVAACQTLVFPQGMALVSTAQFQTYSGCAGSGNFNQPAVHGQGKQSTFLVPVPNFDFTNCNPACFMGGIFEIVGGFAIWGTGYSPAAGNGQVLAENNSGFFTDMDFSLWCQTCIGSLGVKMVGPGAQAQFGGSEYFGATTIYIQDSANGPNGLINFVGFGSNVGIEVNVGVAESLNNTFGGASNTILVDAGATLDSRNDAIYITSAQGGGPISVTGRLNVDHMQTGGFSPTIIQSTGVVTAQNTPYLITNADTSYSGGSYPGNGNHIYNGSWLIENTGGIFKDLGGNSYAGTAYTPKSPTFVQTNNNRVSGSGTTSALSFPITNAGDTVLVLSSWIGSAVASTAPTDTMGNTYTQIGADQTTTATFGTARRTALWYTKTTSTSGADTITCNVASAVTFFMCAPTEFTGQNITTVLDNTYSFLPTAGTGIAVAATESTVAANDEVVEFIATDSTTTYTPGIVSGGPPAGMPQTVVTSAGNFYAIGYGPITPSAVTYSLNGTMSANSDMAVWVVQLKTVATDSTANSIAGSSSINGAVTASSNYVLSAGWGNTPTATIVLAKNPTTGSTRYTITAGTAALGANPTVTFTYPTAFPLVPRCSMNQDGGTQAGVAIPFTVGTLTVTSVVFTYTGTPGASATLTGTMSCQ